MNKVVGISDSRIHLGCTDEWQTCQRFPQRQSIPRKVLGDTQSHQVGSSRNVGQ